MPVGRLHVEGKLDVEVLTPLMARLMINPVVVAAGSKGSLAPKTRDRRETVPLTCYVRDRDFDFEPPADRSTPEVDHPASPRRNAAPEVLGWRWCRHAIECYLLEPTIVERATTWPAAAFSAELIAAARTLEHYSAARWTIGRCKQALALVSKLATRPSELRGEIKLPTDLGRESSARWAEQVLAEHVEAVRGALDPTEVRRHLDRYVHVLGELTTPEDVLLWHSGKDLLAALARPVLERFRRQPHEFLYRLRDWVRDHPDQTLELLPEWRALLSLLQN